jgi:hypothetical protein
VGALFSFQLLLVPELPWNQLGHHRAIIVVVCFAIMANVASAPVHSFDSLCL